MTGKREKPEDIVLKLRPVEVLQGQGSTVARTTAALSRSLWVCSLIHAANASHYILSPERPGACTASPTLKVVQQTVAFVAIAGLSNRSGPGYPTPLFVDDGGAGSTRRGRFPKARAA